MRYILLLMIRVYWRTIPSEKRKKCIFRISCSKHVYRETESFGFNAGIKALKYRFNNCKQGYEIFDNPVDGKIQIILRNGEVLEQAEIADRLLSR